MLIMINLVMQERKQSTNTRTVLVGHFYLYVGFPVNFIRAEILPGELRETLFSSDSMGISRQHDAIVSQREHGRIGLAIKK